MRAAAGCDGGIYASGVLLPNTMAVGWFGGKRDFIGVFLLWHDRRATDDTVLASPRRALLCVQGAMPERLAGSSLPVGASLTVRRRRNSPPRPNRVQ